VQIVIAFGDVVKARVVFFNERELEVFLEYQNESILVLPPEISWVSKPLDLRALFKEGDEVLVKILRYARNRGENGCYIGSTKRVRPAEDNPYVSYARNGINAEYSAEVTALDSISAPGCGRVKLPDGVTGYCWFGPLREVLQVGESIRVFATEVDYERGYAAFALCDEAP
jgi:hypothetical protein